MSHEDIQNARRLLGEAEAQTRSISNTTDRARVKAQIAQVWCQIHQADSVRR